MRRLLIRPGAIGDFILSLPALESLQADYTEIWCSSAVVPLARFANRVISLQSSGIDRVGIVEANDVLCNLRTFDEIYSWYGTNRPEFREFVADLPFRFYRSLPSDGRQHARDFYLSQVGAEGRPVSIPVSIDVALGKTAMRSVFTVLHPFSGSPHKNWPLARWAELADLLAPVQWCCGPDDLLPGAVVIRDLFELAQWISTARVFIGNDSGITHLAAAVGTPTIALFGPTDPAVWSPDGPFVTVIQNRQMDKITVQQVVIAHEALR